MDAKNDFLVFLLFLFYLVFISGTYLFKVKHHFLLLKRNYPKEFLRYDGYLKYIFLSPILGVSLGLAIKIWFPLFISEPSVPMDEINLKLIAKAKWSSFYLVVLVLAFPIFIFASR